MTDIEIQEALQEIIEQLIIQKRALSQSSHDLRIDSDPTQVDIFSENKIDALNYFQNLLCEKFSGYLPSLDQQNSSHEYDIFKKGSRGAVAEIQQMIQEFQEKHTTAGHPSAFEKGVIEGAKRSARIVRRSLHELL